MSQEVKNSRRTNNLVREFGIAPCLAKAGAFAYAPGPYSSAEKQSCFSRRRIRRHVSPLAGLAQNKLFNRVGEPFFRI